MKPRVADRANIALWFDGGVHLHFAVVFDAKLKSALPTVDEHVDMVAAYRTSGVFGNSPANSVDVQ